MILDKLMEKKDLKAYLEFRIDHLNLLIDGAVDKYPPKERGKHIENYKSRRNELIKLKQYLESGKIKKKSKDFCQTVKQKTEKMDN